VALIDLTHPTSIDLAIDLEVPREVVLARLAARRVCTDCGANYSTALPPKLNWSCDYCGGEVIQRADDTEEAIVRRLDLYDRETFPLIDFFRRREEIEAVDGEGGADEVLARLINVIDRRLSAGPRAARS
jgi:adenylate kinase